MRVRSLLLAALWASGCAGAPRELTSGEATRFLGQERWGGRYNPDLAGCTREIGEGPGTLRTVWDDLGRLTSESEPSQPGGEANTFVWDGGCLAESREVMGAAVIEGVGTCNEDGWLTRWTEIYTPPGGSPEPEDVTVYVNTYDDDGRLLMRQDGSEPTVFEWWGNRLLAISDGDGPGHAWTYDEHGWAVDYRSGSEFTWYEYDDRERLVRATRTGSYVEEWRFPSDDADLPDGFASSYDGDATSFAEVRWSCP